jgi:hypothetical protein
MDRQACRDRLVDRCPDAVCRASSNDGTTQRFHLETTAVFEVPGHRRSPLWGQRRGLFQDAIHGGCRKRNPFRQGDGRDLRA